MSRVSASVCSNVAQRFCDKIPVCLCGKPCGISLPSLSYPRLPVVANYTLRENVKQWYYSVTVCNTYRVYQISNPRLRSVVKQWQSNGVVTPFTNNHWSSCYALQFRNIPINMIINYFYLMIDHIYKSSNWYQFYWWKTKMYCIYHLMLVWNIINFKADNVT